MENPNQGKTQHPQQTQQDSPPETQHTGKMARLMQAQSREENAALGRKIESLMENELADTISYHIKKYGKAFENKLGLMKEDLLSDIREQIWKALLTHDPTKKAGIRTYASWIIKNRFKTLSRRSALEKYNVLMYYGDVSITAENDSSEMIVKDTGEAMLEAREAIKVYLNLFTEVDRSVYGFLLQGLSLGEMVSAYNEILKGEHEDALLLNPKAAKPTPMTRVTITAAVNRVQETISRERARG